jgi:hypothetical protein
MVADEADRAVGGRDEQVTDERDTERMRIGEDDLGTHLRDASDLGDGLRQVAKVTQRQRAHDDVEVVVGVRDLFEVGDLEGRAGRSKLRDGQHLRRRIDAVRLVPDRQMLGVATGTARSIEGAA